MSPARSAPLLFRRLGWRGCGTQVSLCFGYCIELLYQPHFQLRRSIGQECAEAQLRMFCIGAATY
jgi:hypothetical protein